MVTPTEVKHVKQFRNVEKTIPYYSSRNCGIERFTNFSKNKNKMSKNNVKYKVYKSTYGNGGVNFNSANCKVLMSPKYILKDLNLDAKVNLRFLLDYTADLDSIYNMYIIKRAYIISIQLHGIKSSFKFIIKNGRYFVREYFKRMQVLYNNLTDEQKSITFDSIRDTMKLKILYNDNLDIYHKYNVELSNKILTKYNIIPDYLKYNIYLNNNVHNSYKIFHMKKY